MDSRTTVRRHSTIFSVLTTLTTLLIVASVTVAITAASPPRAHDQLKSPQLGIISHRGAASEAPENTLASVRAGIERQADFVEIDVRLTADGVPVLMHDTTVTRTTNGAGRVRALTYETIRKLDAGSWFSDEYRGEHVPTLDEFLELFAPVKSLAFIELKGKWKADEVNRVLTQLVEAGVAERVVILSFNETTMRHVSDISPEIARVLLTKDLTTRTMQLINELQVDGIGAQLTLIESERERIRSLKEQGIGCFAYTLNDELSWEAAEVAGVDLIVTDNAAELQQWLDR